MSPRLTAARLSEHLRLEPPATRRIVRSMRKSILQTAPQAAEAIKFHCLCYFHHEAWVGCIGGNICFIEIKDAAVELSFIQGANLPDPHRLLLGRGKAKRHIPIDSAKAASDPRIVAIIRAAAERRPED